MHILQTHGYTQEKVICFLGYFEQLCTGISRTDKPIRWLLKFGTVTSNNAEDLTKHHQASYKPRLTEKHLTTCGRIPPKNISLKHTQSQNSAETLIGYTQTSWISLKHAW